MIGVKEINDNLDDETSLQKGHYINHSNSTKINTDFNAMSTSTTATILQAYAARLSSDSDYAR